MHACTHGAGWQDHRPSAPRWQVKPERQVSPQPPQCWSVLKSAAQRPLHSWVRCGQAHWPLRHTNVSGQASAVRHVLVPLDAASAAAIRARARASIAAFMACPVPRLRGAAPAVMECGQAMNSGREAGRRRGLRRQCGWCNSATFVHCALFKLALCTSRCPKACTEPWAIRLKRAASMPAPFSRAGASSGGRESTYQFWGSHLTSWACWLILQGFAEAEGMATSLWRHRGPQSSTG